MRSRPASYRLMFLLPKGASAVGTKTASAGCEIHVSPPMVSICGPSRERVFDLATGLIVHACQGLPPLSIAAILVSPPPVSGSDSWSIIVGAGVAFSPTSLDPHFPRAAAG